MKKIETKTSDDVPLALEEQPKKEVYFLDIENDLIIIQKEKALLFYFKKSKFNESNTKEIVQSQHATIPINNDNENKIIVIAIINNIDD
jgi:hypothetical protein